MRDTHTETRQGPSEAPDSEVGTHGRPTGGLLLPPVLMGVIALAGCSPTSSLRPDLEWQSSQLQIHALEVQASLVEGPLLRDGVHDAWGASQSRKAWWKVDGEVWPLLVRELLAEVPDPVVVLQPKIIGRHTGPPGGGRLPVLGLTIVGFDAQGRLAQALYVRDGHELVLEPLGSDPDITGAVSCETTRLEMANVHGGSIPAGSLYEIFQVDDTDWIPDTTGFDDDVEAGLRRRLAQLARR